jgi:uncharacterized membrane protein
MTDGSAGRRRDHPSATADGWRGCLPELSVAGLLILATSGVVYGYAGAGAAVLALTIWAVALLVLLRGLVLGTVAPLRAERTWRASGHTSFTGFWRKRASVSTATAAMISYDTELRPVLQHLLAARLAERHGLNLYTDPAAARRLLLSGTEHGAARARQDDQLWYLLDPSRPAETRQGMRGIPPRTLAVILDRLEQL